MAGHLSFTALLAIFPFLIFLTALFSMLGSEQDLQRIVDLMFETMPEAVAASLAPVVAEVVVGRRTGALGFGLVLTLWVASSGIEAVRVAFNRAYAVRRARPFWRRYLQNLLLVGLSALLVPAMSVPIVLGPIVWQVVDLWVDLGFAAQLLWTTMRYGVALAALFVTFVVLHRWLPNRPLRTREILPGVVFTVVAFVIAGTGFSLYLANFANYSVTYGSMASVVIALLFFYITSVVLVLGAYVNADRLRLVDPRELVDRVDVA